MHLEHAANVVVPHFKEDLTGWLLFQQDRVLHIDT